MPTQRPTSPVSPTPSSSPSSPSLRQPLSVTPVEAAPSKEGMSPQTRQTIAIGGLVLCLLIGAGIVYWLLFGASPKHRTIAIDPKEQTVDLNNRQIRYQRRPQAINKDGDNSWQANAGNSLMTVQGQNGGGYEITLLYPTQSFLTSQQSSLISSVVRARMDTSMAAEWGITPDQVEKLKNFHTGGPIIVTTDAERAEMRQLWDAYIKAADGAPKTEPEKALIKRLNELGKANLDASRKAFAAKLDGIKQILTPQQVEKISQR